MVYDFEPADLMACYGTNVLGRVISLGTLTPFAPKRLKYGPSHVALMAECNRSFLWIESTSICKRNCVINGRKISGVQAHRPEDRLADYTASGGWVDLYRLTPIESLSTSESRFLTWILMEHFMGVSYDTTGALISGSRVLKHTRLIPGADAKHLFCSEMVSAILMRLRRLNRDNPTKFNPACLLRTLVRQGTARYIRTYHG